MICVLVGRFGVLNLGSMEVFKTDSLLIAQEFQERKRKDKIARNNLWPPRQATLEDRQINTSSKWTFVTYGYISHKGIQQTRNKTEATAIYTSIYTFICTDESVSAKKTALL
jgi:hypothetical protein